MLCLIECKHYGRPVQVDDVEEFFAKVQQVAAAGSKAILVTSNSFQTGAIEFAQSKKIGLLRFSAQSEWKWELHRSPSAPSTIASILSDADVWRGLTRELHNDRPFDFYCNMGSVFTSSLNVFFQTLAIEAVDKSFLSAIAATQSGTSAVMFLSRDEIEAQCGAVHSVIGYKGGQVSLNSVCDWQARETGLRVDFQHAEPGDASRGILGRITFEPPSILVFFDNLGEDRQRFTLAHELGHLLLGHGSYMRSESVKESDLEKDDVDLGIDDRRHLEWQANYFASCLLLPGKELMASAFRHASYLDLRDRGHGLIFVDNQAVNLQNYYLLTNALVKEFGASRTAINIRLKALGILNDSRPLQADARKFSGIGSKPWTQAARGTTRSAFY